MNKEKSLHPYIIGAYGNKTCGKVYIQKLVEENKQLNMQLNQALKDYDEEMQKNMKAIETIQNYINTIGEVDINEVLEILKGDSNE